MKPLPERRFKKPVFPFIHFFQNCPDIIYELGWVRIEKKNLTIEKWNDQFSGGGQNLSQ